MIADESVNRPDPKMNRSYPPIYAHHFINFSVVNQSVFCWVKTISILHQFLQKCLKNGEMKGTFKCETGLCCSLPDLRGLYNLTDLCEPVKPARPRPRRAANSLDKLSVWPGMIPLPSLYWINSLSDQINFFLLPMMNKLSIWLGIITLSSHY